MWIKVPEENIGTDWTRRDISAGLYTERLRKFENVFGVLRMKIGLVRPIWPICYLRCLIARLRHHWLSPDYNACFLFKQYVIIYMPDALIAVCRAAIGIVKRLQRNLGQIQMGYGVPWQKPGLILGYNWKMFEKRHNPENKGSFWGRLWAFLNFGARILPMTANINSLESNWNGLVI